MKTEYEWFVTSYAGDWGGGKLGLVVTENDTGEIKTLIVPANEQYSIGSQIDPAKYPETRKERQ